MCKLKQQETGLKSPLGPNYDNTTIFNEQKSTQEHQSIMGSKEREGLGYLQFLRVC